LKADCPEATIFSFRDGFAARRVISASRPTGKDRLLPLMVQRRPSRLLRLIPIAVVVSILGSGCGPGVPPERDLLLATASAGGTYYPVGVAMATLATRKLGPETGFNMSAITSSGSAENIALLLNREADLAIIQSLFGALAWEGRGLYAGRPVKNLRALSLVWENVEQIVAYRRDAPTGTVADLHTLHGRRISIADKWSGTEISARTLLTALGHEPDRDFDLAYLSYGPSVEALQNRRLDAMFLAGGVPTGAVTQAFAVVGPDDLVMLEFTSDAIARVRAEYPLWNEYIIPAGTYPGQTRPLPTLSQPNLLVSHADVDAQVVYELLACIYDNLPELHRMHRATREMSLGRALRGLPVPLHPGAVRFYREAGLDIPVALLPPEWTEPGVQAERPRP
jgi:TRAP transporter TAXI family solute receptor